MLSTEDTVILSQMTLKKALKLQLPLINMPGERCFEFIVKDKIQDMGLRLAIAKQVPDEFNIRTDNLSDGSVRIIVRGEEQEVRKFWEELQKQLLGKTENPMFSEPKEIIPAMVDTNRFFHKLECEQLGKFVDVGLEMKDSIVDMKNEIKALPEKIAKAIKE